MYKNLKSKIKSRQFAVIRRRYSLPEVSIRGIHNVIAAAMSICIAFGNKVINTHLPLPVVSGDKYDLERKGLKALKYNVCSGVQCGRSMIEMLGVLAIIGVLSVSGIAGYSKTMQKWRVNKVVQMVTDISSTIQTAYAHRNYDDFDGGWFLNGTPKIQDILPFDSNYTFEYKGKNVTGLSNPLIKVNPLGWSENAISGFVIGIVAPQELCVSLLTYNWSEAGMQGIFLSTDSVQWPGFVALFALANTNFEDWNEVNCKSGDEIDGYVCMNLGNKKFTSISPDIAAKYCESSAVDEYGTGTKVIGFDLLADLRYKK